MKKDFWVVFAFLMIALLLWGVFFENSNINIFINGQEVTGSIKGILGAGGLVVSLVALICFAILLALVFAGTGILIISCLIIGIGLGAALMFPFLFPLLVPLALVWLYILLTKRNR